MNKKTLVLPHVRARKLVVGLILFVALIALVAAFATGHGQTAGKVLLASLAVIPCLGIVVPEEEFQDKVLKGVEALEKSQKDTRSSIEKVTSDIDRADKEVKKALEEFTRVKNDVEKGKEVMNSFDAAMKSMEKVQKAIALNARSSFANPIDKALSDDGLREYLNAVGRAMAFGKNASEFNKHVPKSMQKLIEDMNASQKALTGVDTSLGQATIPSEWFKSIYDTLTEYGQWSLLDVIQVGARTNLVPIATARPAFYWIGAGTGGTGESSAITEGAFTGDSVTLSIQTLAVYLLVARELLADSSVDMAPYIMKQLMQSISFGLDTAAFIGAGTANQTHAGYYGIFNAASVNTNLAATAGAGNTTIEATQLEDWQRAMLTVSQQVLQRNPRWFLNPQILIRSLGVRDKNGRPLFQTYTEAPMPGGIGSILGAPTVPVAVAPTTNSAGATVAVFGEPAGQAVGIRSDIEFATSDDIKFAENMRAFRGLVRAGVIPKTKAASTTLKPFAVLTLAAN